MRRQSHVGASECRFAHSEATMSVCAVTSRRGVVGIYMSTIRTDSFISDNDEISFISDKKGCFFSLVE